MLKLILMVVSTVVIAYSAYFAFILIALGVASAIGGIMILAICFVGFIVLIRIIRP